MNDSNRIRAALSLLNIKPGLLLRHYDFEETGRYRKVYLSDLMPRPIKNTLIWAWRKIMNFQLACMLTVVLSKADGKLIRLPC